MGYQTEMKYAWLLLIAGCVTSTPIPNPPKPTQIIIYDTTHIKIIHYDTTRIPIFDSAYIFDLSGTVNIKDFGAKGDGSTDDHDAILTACNFCIANPSVCTTVRFPIGNYRINEPILLQNKGKYFTIKLTGDVSNKSSSDGYLSKITYSGLGGYAIGIQYGRSVEIENLTILGQYTFPYSVSNYNIGTLKFSDWAVPNITDSRYKPYAGIVIDPDTNVSGTRGGTSDVTIKNCSIKQWMVGICLSPNGVTQNDEMINILEDDIEACRVAIAVCQDQAKTINIKGLKVWSSVHTVLDGLTYGIGTGGGSIFCENWNIAGNCKELFNITTGRFPLSCKDLYSESLFRIGNVGSGTGTNFINTEIDFLSGPGWPESDWLIQGQANFYGGMLRYYDNDGGHRLNFATTGYVRYPFMFRDMTVSSLPITQGLYGVPTNYWYSARFENVHDYNSGYDVTQKSDTLINVSMSALTIDRINWVGTATINGVVPKVNDYLLAEPTSTTANYYDGVGNCTTKVLGRITSVNGNTTTLDHVSVNAFSGSDYGRIFIDRIK